MLDVGGDMLAGVVKVIMLAAAVTEVALEFAVPVSYTVDVLAGMVGDVLAGVLAGVIISVVSGIDVDALAEVNVNVSAAVVNVGIDIPGPLEKPLLFC